MVGEGGFGEREQINGIKDVGFALTVQSDKAVEFGRELKGGFADVAVV